jgi:transposase-like protein
MSRTRYTDEEKNRIIREFEESGGSAAAFCRQAEISYQTLMNWRRRTHGSLPSTTGSPAFLEFEIGSASRRPAQAGPLVELELGGGMILRIHSAQPGQS